MWFLALDATQASITTEIDQMMLWEAKDTGFGNERDGWSSVLN